MQIVIIWSLILFKALVTTQAFLTAPLSAYARGLSSYDIAESSEKLLESNEVLRQNNDDDDDDSMEDDNQSKTVYVIEFESDSEENDEKSKNKDNANSQNPLDPWSIVWYIGSFGGLVTFFLIVSCSECCCRHGSRSLAMSYNQRGEVIGAASSATTDTPPPPYHLFAPPPYDSINYGDIVDKTSGEKLEIYVISVPNQSSVRQEPA